MINLPTKFEVPNFTRYGNMKGVARCRKWGGLGWLGVTQAIVVFCYPSCV